MVILSPLSASDLKMNSHDAEAIQLRIPWIVKFAPLATLLLSAAVLLSWAIHGLEPQIALLALRSMKCNTALLFAFVGVALFACQRPYPAWRRIVVRVCGGAVLLAALLTVLEFISARNLGIDEFLQADDTSIHMPGRMALATAVSFAALGGALLLVTSNIRFPLRVAQCLLIVPILVSLFVLVGYFYGSSLVYLNCGHTAA